MPSSYVLYWDGDEGMLKALHIRKSRLSDGRTEGTTRSLDVWTEGGVSSRLLRERSLGGVMTPMGLKQLIKDLHTPTTFVMDRRLVV